MKKTNNKGFSLVELIIVIAIMVILVAVIAPQYLKFVHNSRISTDVQTAADMATAIDVAIANGAEPFPSGSFDIAEVDNLSAVPATKLSDYSFLIEGTDTEGVTGIYYAEGSTKKFELYPNPESTASGLKGAALSIDDGGLKK